MGNQTPILQSPTYQPGGLLYMYLVTLPAESNVGYVWPWVTTDITNNQ